MYVALDLRFALCVVMAGSFLSCAGKQERGHANGAARVLSEQNEDTTARDREVLSALSDILGGPLPSPSSDDLVGVEELTPGITRTYARDSRNLRSKKTRLRATAWHNRVHSLEVSFVEGCNHACARPLSKTLDAWVGPVRYIQDGHAEFYSANMDTLTVVLEVYPNRPSLTRLLMRCQPLYERSHGRPSVLPNIGEKRNLDDNPPCRRLM
jgi:hypothetical protein